AEASLAEGEVWGTEVECPRHGSEFDLKTGEPGSLPATRPVPTYEVSVEDGTVFLHLEDS
ncbi:MAG: bifunctional 3-phenylpropionate/cinnamic acid dioxygenase ferredoxin subunit, partial [Actinobacteria bacterium]